MVKSPPPQDFELEPGNIDDPAQEEYEKLGSQEPKSGQGSGRPSHSLNSSSSGKGRINYNRGSQRSHNSSSSESSERKSNASSSSTADGDVNYTDEVPEEERSLYTSSTKAAGRRRLLS